MRYYRARKWGIARADSLDVKPGGAIIGAMFRPAIMALTVFALGGCSMVPGSQRSQGTTVSRSPPAGQCLTRLGAAGVSFTPLPDRYPAQGCSNIGTVQMRAIASDSTSVPVANLGPTTCEVSQAFASWARFGVDRAARQILGQSLRSIETFGSYSCRNVAGTGRRSAHATATAIDVSAFVLQDGRRITVREGWGGGTRAEQQFLRTVHQSACKRFSHRTWPRIQRRASRPSARGGRNLGSQLLPLRPRFCS